MSLSGYIDPDYTTLYPIVNPQSDPKVAMDIFGGFADGSVCRAASLRLSVSNWTVTGTNLEYSVAGPGSVRIDDLSGQMTYTGSWSLTGGVVEQGIIRAERFT